MLSDGLLFTLTVQEKEEQFQLGLGAKKGFFSNTTEATEGFFVLTPKDQPTIELGEPISSAPPIPVQTMSEPVVMGGVDKVFAKMEQYTLANLSQRDLKRSLGVPGSGGILVTGAHGSGKSSLVHNLLSRMRQHHIYTLEIACSQFAEERVPVLKEMIQTKLDEAAWHGPTLVFLDDIDRLIPAEVEHADSTKSRHMAELVVRMVSIASQRHPIMLIATAQQQQSIHPALITHHIFSDLNHLQPPGRDERKLVS